MKDLVSIIIPNYNKEKYLSQCLDSILAQTYPYIEIVIVDDLSKDSSREIIRQYAEKYTNIVPVLLEKNGGVSHARNTGIAKASGKYVTMLDSDDYYYNNKKIENEMKALKEHNGEGIAYSYRVDVNENCELLYSSRRNEDRYCSGDIFYSLMTQKYACEYVQRDYILKKEYMLEAGGYNEKESYYEDFDLLLRLASKHKMYYTNGDGTAYRYINTGLSSTQRKKDAAQFIVPQKIRMRYMDRLKGTKRMQAYIIWILEMVRLEIRINGRKVKRLLGK